MSPQDERHEERRSGASLDSDISSVPSAAVRIDSGRAHPVGAHVVDGGVNFSVFSENATSVELLLFERPTDAEPAFIRRTRPRKALTGQLRNLSGRGTASAAPNIPPAEYEQRRALREATTLVGATV